MLPNKRDGMFPFGYRQAAITGVAAALPDDDALRKCRYVSIYFMVTNGVVRARWDGVQAPDAATGRPFLDRDEPVFTKAEAAQLQMVLGQGTTSATYHAHYYRGA